MQMREQCRFATKRFDGLSTLCHTTVDGVTCGQLPPIIARITTQSAFADGHVFCLRGHVGHSGTSGRADVRC